MPRLAIVGLGLIGGSVGLALKRAQPQGLEVVGFDRESGVTGRARKLGAIDVEARSPTAAVGGAAVVVIATPIAQIQHVLEELAPALGEDTVVTDTASTKREVVGWASRLLPEAIAFIGGHPMAGKETAGVDAADAALFDGRPWAITPTPRTTVRAIQTAESLARLVGAVPVVVDPEEHDSYVAAASHLPLILASALFSLVSSSQAWPDIAALAGPGFIDTTRLASTNPDLSHDIALTNRQNIVHWIDRLTTEVRRWRELIADASQTEELAKALFETQTTRDAFLMSPPRHPEPSQEGTKPLSASEQMMALMVGEYAVRRRKEITDMAEGGGTGPEEQYR